ncbi:MAG: DUF2277 domain-containing protein [Pseudonocardiales bacterium]|nr:MAG: DUF2277 domain-containing protein [Pseudonocardiales bacterium]
MCRSIKTLRPPVVEHATETEVREAALQYVRKISGYRVPSRTNAAVFEAAVAAVAESTRQLLDGLSHRPPSTAGPSKTAQAAGGRSGR